MSGWDAVLQASLERQGAKRQHKQGLEDEQRKQHESFLAQQAQSGAISPAQWAQATHDLYQHEPTESRWGRIGRGLERIVGQGKRADAQKAEADQKLGPSPKKDLASIEAGAKSPQALEEEAATAKSKRETGETEATQKAVEEIMANPNLTDDQKRVLVSVWGAKANLPTSAENKHAAYLKAVEGGYQGSEVQWSAEEGAKGRASGTPAKPPAMKPGMSGGKNVYGYYSTDKKAWIDSNTQQPMTDFKPAPSFSQTGLWGLDVGYDAQGNASPILLNRRTGEVKTPPAGIVAPGQTKDIEKQRTTAIASDSLLRTMLGNQKDALAGNQQAMLSLVANHIGMTLGAQKGARINQAVWNEAVSSAPWLQKVEAKFGPDGYLSGVTLAPEQINQMVELAKQRRQILWQQFADTAQANGVTADVPEFKESSSPAPKKGGAKQPKEGDTKKNSAGDEVIYRGGKWQLK